ncbi:MAG TPA: protein kinase, partial [Thermoanaerobaculia bacterium]
MTLSAGSRLGPYEVISAIGAGGMGEVYRAKDPRLGREVAIKVLPASFSHDTDRLRRFEQEARAAGLLNHPNITAVYDIGSVEGAPYVVSELLEGETLRSALAAGRLSPRRAIDYSLQVAHGLAAAHEKGIVHRDLKPENLFVTRDGRVKILDFGLAKLTHQEEGSQATNIPTASAGTEPGVVLGTLGYMSPEQVRGRAADARSDIFSFGAILYEMLSGKRAFQGDSAADTMSAILREDPPDLSVTNQAISPGLERIVRHCLEKSPEQRFHSAHDLAFDLEALSGASGQSAAGAAPAVRAARLPWLPAAAIAGVAAAFAAGHFLWKAPEPGLPSFQRVTFRRGNLGNARFAPDGNSVVYGASWEGAPIEIYSTRLGSPESTPLGYRNADLFSVSSSGELALSLRDRFLSGAFGIGTLARAPAGGGPPRPVLDYVERAEWSPEGKELAVVRFREGRNQLEFPIGKVLYSASGPISPPRFSPGGDRIAFHEVGKGLLAVDLSGKARQLGGPASRYGGHDWSPSGEEIWFNDRGPGGEGLLRALSLSGETRVLLRAPDRIILHDVAPDGRVLVERAAGRHSVRALPPGGTRERDLSWFDGSGTVAISADGTSILLQEAGDAGGPDGSFYLRKTDGSPAVKLGDGWAKDLSPDGRTVLATPKEVSTRLLLVPTGAGNTTTIETGGLEV